MLYRLRDTNVMITDGALTGLCRLGPSSGCLRLLKMCMNTLQGPSGNCSSHQSSPADSAVTSVTEG